MRQKFEVTGLFYDIEGVKCRKYLDIRRIGLVREQTMPDLNVVMMNPGSSYPLYKVDNNDRASVAVPDPTQDQIMAVMLNAGFSFARVINLSDVRQPSSEQFYKFLESDNSNRIHHSLFCDSRKEEFIGLFNRNAVVIYAWGVNPKLKKLATKAMERIDAENPTGIKKFGSEWAYYHPLPRVYSEQVRWVKVISEMLNNA